MTPYGPVRTKEFQSAGVSAVTFVRDQRPGAREGGARGPAAGELRRTPGPGDLVRQPEGRRRQDDYDAEPRRGLRREGPPRAVRRSRPSVEPDDEPGDRSRLARAVDVRRAREPGLDPRGHPQAGQVRGLEPDGPAGRGRR